MIPLDGDVDRHPDVPSVAGLNLMGEQLLPQVRVLAFGKNFGVEIKPAVMAARKASDRVNVCFHQRLGKIVRVEIRPNRFDEFTGVEIEVDLTKAQFSFHP